MERRPHRRRLPQPRPPPAPSPGQHFRIPRPSRPLPGAGGPKCAQSRSRSAPQTCPADPALGSTQQGAKAQKKALCNAGFFLANLQSPNKYLILLPDSFKCHKITSTTRTDNRTWNLVVTHLTRGLLFGHEVPKPTWYKRERKRARHRKLTTP